MDKLERRDARDNADACGRHDLLKFGWMECWFDSNHPH